MASITSCLGTFEDILKTLADIERRIATAAQRIGGADTGLMIKENADLHNQDDLVSRFERNLHHFIDVNEAIIQSFNSIDDALGIDTGPVTKPKTIGRPFNPKRPIPDGFDKLDDHISAALDERMQQETD